MEFEMRKFALFLLLTLNFLFTVVLCATENSITVKVTGQGLNQTEALEDALRNAVRKVVGTYVVTQSKLQEEDFDESIYINADAVVTQHKVLKKRTEDGLVVLEIEATVITNDLLKYYKKTESTQISSTDLGNLLNRRRALATAELSLEYIFKDYWLRLYRAKKTKDFRLAADDDVENDTVKITMTYELSFEKQEYNKLSKRLKNLLEKVAIQKEVGRDLTYNQICGYDGAFRRFDNKNSESWPSGTETVSFCEEYLINGEKKYSYAIYAVPKQIRKKIDNLISSDSVLVFQFQLKDGSKRIGMLQPRLSFFEYDNSTLTFRNWLGAKIPNYSWKYFSKQEYERDWSFSEDVIRNMKSCTIKAYSGKQADYLWYLHRGDSYYMKSLANRGYIPAMIAMAEVFKDSGWYEAAALAGSRYAQEKLSWQNSGLGFSLDKDGAWYVTSSQKNVPVKKGMKIKLLNGENIERWDYEKLSQYIGVMSPGTSVSVELYDGKKIEITTRD